MTRQEAMAAIRQIQEGSGVDRSTFPDELKGLLAKDQWNNPAFSLGWEYGKIAVLMEAFNITVADLIEDADSRRHDADETRHYYE